VEPFTFIAHVERGKFLRQYVRAPCQSLVSHQFQVCFAHETSRAQYQFGAAPINIKNRG